MLDKSLKPNFKANNFFKPNREDQLLLIKSSFVRLLFIISIWYLFFVLYIAKFEEKPGFTATIIWLIGIYVVLELVTLFLNLSLNRNNNSSEIINPLMSENKSVSPTSQKDIEEYNQEKIE